MFHTIEFAATLNVDLEVSPRQRLERQLLRKGSRARAEITSYVVTTSEGPVELADLYFEDGAVARGVPLDQLRFID